MKLEKAIERPTIVRLIIHCPRCGIPTFNSPVYKETAERLATKPLVFRLCDKCAKQGETND